MSLYNGPPRGGSRGGRDQFNWENVKADKDREFYLGHSVNALQGRWQKGKDPYWYAKGKADQEAAEAAELLAVKQREEDLMAEALGIKPKTIRAPKQPMLDQREMAQLMQRGDDEEEEDPARQAERIKGLGYKINAMTGAGEAEREVLAGTAPAPPAPGQQAQTNGAALPLPPALSAADAKRMRKAQKKAAKEQRRAEKKEKRRAKKALKKAKKEARQAKDGAKAKSPMLAKSPAPSSSGSSSSEEGSEDEPATNGGGAAAEESLKRRRQDSPGSPQQPAKRAMASGDSRHRRRHDSESPRPRRDTEIAPARHERAEHWRDSPERNRGEPHRHAAASREGHRRGRSPDHRRRDAAARDASLSPPGHRASRDPRRVEDSRAPR